MARAQKTLLVLILRERVLRASRRSISLLGLSFYACQHVPVAHQI